MTDHTALQYVVELERERAAAVARAEEAESALARAGTRIKDLEFELARARGERDEARDLAEHGHEVDSLRQERTRDQTRIAELERERDEARESAEYGLKHGVETGAIDVEEATDGLWLSAEEFCKKYDLDLPDDLSDDVALDEPELDFDGEPIVERARR